MKSGPDKYSLLSELIQELLSERITLERFAMLKSILRNDRQARRYYVEYMFVDYGLQQNKVAKADGLGLLVAEEIARKDILNEIVTSDLSRLAYTSMQQAKVQTPIGTDEIEYQRKSPNRRFIFEVFGAIAALIAIAFILTYVERLSRVQHHISKPPVALATLTDTRDVQWGDILQINVGSELYAGPIEINKGLVELKFIDEARVIVEGPAQIELLDVDHMKLHNGKLTAYVPPKAYGFKVDMPNAYVMDLGTEFGVRVNDVGDRELHVFDGEVVLYAGPETGKKRVQQNVLAGNARFIKAGEDTIRIKKLDEYAFYRKIPSPYEMEVRKNNPIIYWRFNHDGNSTLVNEANPQRAAGSFIGNVIFAEGRDLGDNKSNYAIMFGASGAYVEIPNIPSTYKDENAYTVAMWICPKVISAQDIFVSKQDNKYRRIAMAADGKIEHYIYTGGLKKGTLVQSQTIAQPGKWYHVVVTAVGDGYKQIYVNGIKEGEPATMGETAKLYSKAYIGDCPDKFDSGIPFRVFKGGVDEIAWFNRELSPEEIRQLYESVSP
ncbi:MAG: FecR domain-containing protein [Phycisphaerae bacterium]|nr:FecR domain-containing protein [Phycisphaerae bacterium]